MTSRLIDIAQRFQIKDSNLEIKPLGKGNISDNYLVFSQNNQETYLLQKKNKNVFINIPGMMMNIDKVTSHLKDKIVEKNGDPHWETVTIIKTKDNKQYYQDEFGEYWAMSLYIDNHYNFEIANTPNLAYAFGKGIGKFQSMLADFDEPLVDTLPGYHNIKFRFDQWKKVLAEDPLKRSKDLQKEINWIEERKEDMMSFWTKIETNIIPKRVAHNDAKISNILFDKEFNTTCVIDLDTILNSTILFDFGDAIRSSVNTGQEDDPNLNNVNLDLSIFKSFTEGYISQVKTFISEIEIENLAFSARYITYEQAMRFLMDYIDGDTYYKITSPNHNLIRARAQFKLLQSIESKFEEMSELIRLLTIGKKI